MSPLVERVGSGCVLLVLYACVSLLQQILNIKYFNAIYLQTDTYIHMDVCMYMKHTYMKLGFSLFCMEKEQRSVKLNIYSFIYSFSHSLWDGFFIIWN